MAERCVGSALVRNGRVMKARGLLEGSFHTPETLKIVGKAYDDAWAEIAHHFDGDAEKARLRLAHAY